MRPFAPVLLLFVSGCARLGLSMDEPTDPPYDVAVHVESDPGKALAGAELQAEGHPVGTTDATGTLKLQFTGKEGDRVELVVKCPAGHDSPTTPTLVTLRRLAASSRLPTYTMACAPKVRTVVVGVRAENGPNLPVVYLGRPVGRTDGAGAAHVLLSPKAGEQVELTLVTTEKGAEGLRPQNPTLTFVSKAYDDFVVLEQKFVTERKPEVHRPTGRPTPKPMPL